MPVRVTLRGFGDDSKYEYRMRIPRRVVYVQFQLLWFAMSFVSRACETRVCPPGAGVPLSAVPGGGRETRGAGRGAAPGARAGAGPARVGRGCAREPRERGVVYAQCVERY